MRRSLENIMKRATRVLICALAGGVGALASAAATQAAAPAITVLTTFDYPGAGNSTTPYGINNRGDVAGDFVDASGVRRGFIRYSNGNFSAPIVEPDDTGSFTRARGINSARAIDGDFFNVADNAFHGYILSGGVFTQFDIGPGLSTDLFGLNDAGNFVGAYGSTGQPTLGFVNIAGTTTVITIPGQTDSFADAINNSNQVVGEYDMGSGLPFQGFFRDSNGALTFPIAVPRATTTSPNGLSDLGLIVGRYTKADNIDHGFLLKLPRTFVGFDYPGATGTSLNGINKSGLICGRYTDAAGLRHGFIAQSTR
jgi:hypothetical protein